jgi:23S rRNA A2030 N6-methylase RlmJ
MEPFGNSPCFRQLLYPPAVFARAARITTAILYPRVVRAAMERFKLFGNSHNRSASLHFFLNIAPYDAQFFTQRATLMLIDPWSVVVQCL